MQDCSSGQHYISEKLAAPFNEVSAQETKRPIRLNNLARQVMLTDNACR